jgi:arylsulfatase A-like enzyme
MPASRAIWHDGWRAVSTHPTVAGWSNVNQDTWELYHVDVDRAELHDLAGEHPDKLRELINRWFSEAGANGAIAISLGAMFSTGT